MVSHIIGRLSVDESPACGHPQRFFFIWDVLGTCAESDGTLPDLEEFSTERLLRPETATKSRLNFEFLHIVWQTLVLLSQRLIGGKNLTIRIKPN